MSTHARHVLHENGQRSLHRVSQTAVILDNPLVAQVLQKLDFTLQRAHLLHERKKKTHHKQSSFPSKPLFFPATEHDEPGMHV